MSETWLVLDCNYLCHRAGHVFPQLTHGGEPTGVLYGFFRDLVHLQIDHQCTNLVFCFDHGKAKRKRLLPTYKAGRVKSAEEQALRDKICGQIDLLREKYLPMLGYKNIFAEDGYEADDLIASVVMNCPGEFIMVSADEDLYQLLAPGVMMWSPRKMDMMTWQGFEKEWGLTPTSWKDVKAMAGCSSDNIKGIPGIGNKTAAKWLNGTLPTHIKAYQLIVQFNKKWDKNLPLVTLPFPGTPKFKLRHDNIDEKVQRKVYRQLGIESL
jgi:DNA polymerase I